MQNVRDDRSLEDEVLFNRYGIKGYACPDKQDNDDESPCMLKKKVISL